ncbi:MAG: phosphoenolpyruvate--protein phosphotransferase [Clostridiales bacterium]
MLEKILYGIGVSSGISIGKVFVVDKNEEYYEYKNISSDKVSNELKRLNKAREKCAADLDKLIEKVKVEFGDEKAFIIEGQKSFLTDPSFYPEIEGYIKKDFFSAEKALKKVVEKFVDIFEKMNSDYMKERASDIKDIGNRFSNYLNPDNKIFDLKSIKEKVILVADDLLPSDTVQLERKYILGLVIAKGGKTSHTSIFASSMGIPAVISINNLCNLIKNNDNVIVDGDKGICIINPEKTTLEKYKQRLENKKTEVDLYNKYKKEKAITKDGLYIKIAANIGSLDEAIQANENGAEGIGLLRTEQVYMSSKKLPDEEIQLHTYKGIVDKMSSQSVIIRTLDIGGDKELPYLENEKELNPFLGYRAIRLCLGHEEIFITQLRAILRASAFGKIKLLIPMISCFDELKKTKDLIEKVKKQLSEEKIAFDKEIKLGMMIEIPSTAIMIENYVKEVDFFSIGTNDLVQYTMAVDRINDKVSYLYDNFHPAIINLIKKVTEVAHSHGKFVGICGSMAGEYLAIPIFIALGIDELSMTANSIPKIKYTINQLSRKDCILLLNKILKCQMGLDIKSNLQNFLLERKLY